MKYAGGGRVENEGLKNTEKSPANGQVLVKRRWQC